ncbi:MAG: cytochrome c peroxidase [Pseudomonadota bacterium]
MAKRKRASHFFWLLVLLSVSEGAIAESWRATSEGGAFRLQLQPLAARLELGQTQAWHLIIHDSDGRPVRGATVQIGGGMQDHGHGLPTQPQVVEQLKAGSYLLEGLRFNMAGSWVLALSIDSAAARDRALIAIEIPVANAFDHGALAEFALARGLRPPASPSNKVADNALAAKLGAELFNDARLSGTGEISCASCHQVDRSFTDGKALGQGLGRALRNTPSLLGVSHQRWFYWDGRRDSLWAQALVPFEAPDEMGSSRVAIVRKLVRDPNYVTQYQALFGKVPSNIRVDSLPPHAGPIGSSESKEAWFRLPRSVQRSINTVFSNLGKSIAAYERTLAAPITRFDKHALAKRGQSSGLSAKELAGLALFFNDEKTHCLRCHNGRMFTNNDFHNIGTGRFTGKQLDFGRIYGLQSAIRDEFNCLGPFSDAPSRQCTELNFLSKSTHVPLEGAFKVPSLRNLTQTAPFMHDGRYASLREVLEHYRNPPLDGPKHELRPLNISDEEAEQLLAFLQTLSPDDD